MRRALGLAALLAAGCDGVFTRPFGAGVPDAASDEAAADASPDARPAVHRYVISSQSLPDLSRSADALGLDLDGDGEVDNKFGNLMKLIADQGLDPARAANLAILRGEVILLPELVADSFTDGPATFTLYSGANPDPPPCSAVESPACGHLGGNATFDLEPNSAHDAPLPGVLIAGEMVSTRVDGPSPADAGRLELDVSFYQTPVTFQLIGARVKIVTPSEHGIASGVIAGGVTQSDVKNQIFPELARALDAEVRASCTIGGAWPDCGCSPQSVAAKLLDTFDRNMDCRLDRDDLVRSPAISAMLEPYVTIDGLPLVSFGIGFTAVKATFRP
ncbi:MAG: hypothetical protein ACTHU0_38725 [Kofleriaceae bacterium]